MSSVTWTEFFKDKVAKLEDNFKQEAPQGISLLGFALKNNVISSAEYLTWAQDNYLLATIKKDFFQKKVHDHIEWLGWKNIYAWTTEVQPIGQWEEHLIVGCLEIPINFPLELKPIFLLCDFESLENLWQLRTQPHDAKSNLLGSANPKPSIKPPSSKLNISDSPEMILLDEDEIELPPAPTEEDLEIPEGLQGESTQDFSYLTKTQSSGQQQPVVQGLKEDTRTQTLHTSIKASTQGQSKYLLNLLFDPHSSAFRVKCEELFFKLQSHFEKTMILSLDAEEQILHPHFWDNRFVSGSASDNTIPLKDASVFKIVNVTQKPFHGPIVVNPINEKFFDDWNQGVIPAHITIIPLIINSRIAGMILAVGEKSCSSYAVMKFMENACRDLGQSLSAIIDANVA